MAGSPFGSPFGPPLGSPADPDRGLGHLASSSSMYVPAHRAGDSSKLSPQESSDNQPAMKSRTLDREQRLKTLAAKQEVLLPFLRPEKPPPLESLRLQKLGAGTGTGTGAGSRDRKSSSSSSSSSSSKRQQSADAAYARRMSRTKKHVLSGSRKRRTSGDLSGSCSGGLSGSAGNI